MEWSAENRRSYKEYVTEIGYQMHQHNIDMEKHRFKDKVKMNDIWFQEGKIESMKKKGEWTKANHIKVNEEMNYYIKLIKVEEMQKLK